MMKFQTYIDRKNEYRWRLLAANNRTVADSGEGYARYEDCLHAIQLIQQNVGTASIDQAHTSDA